ncbi:MAG: hypothetical protein ABIN95_13410 [Mucilaginibacter sp.]
MRILFTIMAFAIIAIGCNNQDKSANYETVHLDTDDKVFLALKETAQNKLPVFIDSIKLHGLDTNYLFVVKSDFADGDEHEHMWSTCLLTKTVSFRECLQIRLMW